VKASLQSDQTAEQYPNTWRVVCNIIC